MIIDIYFFINKMSHSVLASWFDDKIGYKNNNLYDGGLYYAELSKDYKKKDFSFGTLPYGQKLKITYKGKSCIASKRDEKPFSPSRPKISLHINLAKALGFDLNKELDYVTIQKF